MLPDRHRRGFGTGAGDGPGGRCGGGEEVSKRMDKYSTYQIETESFEKILVGVFHMIQTVPLGSKCRVVLDYDPALQKTTIETFIDKSDMEKFQGKSSLLVPYEAILQSGFQGDQG